MILNFGLLVGLIVMNDMFTVDNETFEWFRAFKVARDNVKLTHEQLFQHLNKKMEKLKLRFKILQVF